VSARKDISRELHPGGLWSLWDMLKVNGQAFYRTSLALDRMRIRLENGDPNRAFTGGPTSDGLRIMLVDLAEFRETFLSLGVPMSLKSLDRLIETVKEPKCTFRQASRGMAEVESRIRDELENVSLFAIKTERSNYLNQPKLFGDQVFSNFPSANNDILEAGNCVALERGTAAVMHLMRVAEVGLRTVSKALGVDPQSDWGGYLREIDKALDARVKASGKRTPDEQFYAEVRVTLDGVRIAWRNATMHVENTYSTERAEEILISVRGLMRHLATKLSEWPWGQPS
jgi:hypothetical protein